MMSEKNTFMCRATGWIFRVSVVVAILFATTSMAVTQASAQTPRVTVHAVDMPLGNLLKLIETQCGYTFAYNTAMLDLSRRVTLQATNSNIEYVLRTILRDTGCTYIITKMHIIVVPVSAAPIRLRTTRTAPVTRQPEVRWIQRQRPVVELGDIPRFETLPVQMAAVPPAPVPAPTPTPAPVPQADAPQVAETPAAVTPVTPALSNKTPLTPQSPLLAVKTNLLFDATSTMNLGFEVRVSPKWTMELAGSYNPWSWADNRKFKSIIVQPEFRRWFCDPFSGHFLGVHAHWAHYNFGNLPFGKLKTNRYQGDLAGAGFSYGYSWYIDRRWALEATLGVGYAYMNHQRFERIVCGTCFGWENKHYVGITKLGLNLSFLLK